MGKYEANINYFGGHWVCESAIEMQSIYQFPKTIVSQQLQVPFIIQRLV